jgi:hypothetical protein
METSRRRRNASAAGSGEKMRKVGAKGAPAKAAATAKKPVRKRRAVMGILNNGHDDFEDREDEAIEQSC